MAITRAGKRKEMAEATCCSATPPPSKRKGKAAESVHGLFTYSRRCIHPLNRCDGDTTQPQEQNTTAGKSQVGGWKVLLGPNHGPSPESLDLHTSSEEKSEMPHENQPRDSLSRSSLRAERGQNDKMNDENVAPNSTSIGMTEVFHRCRKSFEVDAEVESAYKSALAAIGKYKVKEEQAPMLGKIFGRYGDIAEESDLSCSESLSHFLGMVCDICLELKSTSFADISLLQVDEMLRKIDDSERVGLKVKWLREKLIEVKDMKELVGGYNDFKENRAKIETKKEELKKQKADLALYQQEVKANLAKLHQKLDLLTDELTSMKAKDKHTHQKIQKRKEKIKAYYNQDLVEGLL
ncbi:OLC1v1010938C1 [Oldenlandia corymbosa var. corymbosa]|uniref:OLC1v1010938C1 n=1 Tax=Oldenlandia corymbosa var. corymbosa TaxID=529605 RepID=A0AAV1DVY2_OLDCO|nr:OLC1v1010938C1 [Oldenlandia corymbosa var. corymbosa]